MRGSFRVPFLISLLFGMSIETIAQFNRNSIYFIELMISLRHNYPKWSHTIRFDNPNPENHIPP